MNAAEALRVACSAVQERLMALGWTFSEEERAQLEEALHVLRELLEAEEEHERTARNPGVSASGRCLCIGICTCGAWGPDRREGQR